jgi:hypothetical protein
VGFEHQPDFAANLELQRIAGRNREMDFHFDSALHPRRDDYIALIQGNDSPGNYVPGA